VLQTMKKTWKGLNRREKEDSKREKDKKCEE
jgi:hypothetical protein